MAVILPPGSPPGSTSPSNPPPAPQPAALPPDVFKGYADLRQSVAVHVNKHLYNAAALDADTLKVLSRKRKVGR